MHKGWHFLWILWLVLGILNLLFVNVYANHAGYEEAGRMTLGLYQQLGYLGLSMILFLFCGLWLIFVGNDNGRKGVTITGVVITSLFGLLIVGSLVYTLAFGGKYLSAFAALLAKWFAVISF